jgi:membrane-associated phospholipid phosphatase
VVTSPDRLSIEAHLGGAPFSGKSLDSFPSSHAVHIGALASAATELPPGQRNLVWSAGAALALTRIVLLAHWTSDIAAGISIGAALERIDTPLNRVWQI